MDQKGLDSAVQQNYQYLLENVSESKALEYMSYYQNGNEIMTFIIEKICDKISTSLLYRLRGGSLYINSYKQINFAKYHTRLSKWFNRELDKASKLLRDNIEIDDPISDGSSDDEDEEDEDKEDGKQTAVTIE
jgi:hypothetical protein